jgi:hypothetical protein
MSEITTVGLDLAKRVVSLCGEVASGRVVVQRSAVRVVRSACAASGRSRPACSPPPWSIPASSAVAGNSPQGSGRRLLRR